MSTQIQRRRGTTAEHSTFTGVEGELTVDTTKDTAVVHDGTTVGGHPLQKQYPPLGSAAAPTYTFTGDTNTGIYSPGADQVAVATNGTGRLFVNSAGLVGIGVSGPNSTLHVAGSLTVNDKIFLQRASGSLNLAIASYWDGSTNPLSGTKGDIVAIGNTGGDGVAFVNADTERMRLTSTGLGIGTSSPSSKLHVLGDATNYGITSEAPSGYGALNIAQTGGNSISLGMLSNNLFVYDNTAGLTRLTLDSSGNVGIGTANLVTTFTAYGGTVGLELDTSFGFASRANTGTLRAYDRAAAAYRDLGITGANILFGISDTEKARIDSNGRLGIGISSPGDVLHVKGGSTYAGVIADNSAATGGGAFRAYRNGVQKAIFCADSWVTGTSSDDAAIYADAGGGIKFYTNNSSTAKAVLTSAGSLGIGTTSPSTTLSIGASASSSYNGGVCLNRGPSAYNFYEASDGTNSVIFGLDNTLTTAKIGTVNSYPLGFFTGNTEKARIDASGRLLIGTSSARDNFFNTSGLGGLLQVEGANNNARRVISHVYGVTGPGGPMIALGKHRGNSVGDNTVVQSGDECGLLSFLGSDGTEFVEAAQIRAEADGTPGANDMPGRLVFSTTADGASSPTERMRITSTGQVRLAGAGITFNGDTATANELDDYEEGTWTPSVGGTATYTHQDGRYTKIGNTVHVRDRKSVV